MFAAALIFCFSSQPEDMEDDTESDSSSDTDDDDVMMVDAKSADLTAKTHHQMSPSIQRSGGSGVRSMRSYMRVSKKRKKKFKFRDVSRSSFVRREGETYFKFINRMCGSLLCLCVIL